MRLRFHWPTYFADAFWMDATQTARLQIFIHVYIVYFSDIPEVVVLQTKRSSIVRFQLDYFTQCAPTWSTNSDLTWHIIKAVFLYSWVHLFPVFCCPDLDHGNSSGRVPSRDGETASLTRPLSPLSGLELLPSNWSPSWEASRTLRNNSRPTPFCRGGEKGRFCWC